MVNVDLSKEITLSPSKTATMRDGRSLKEIGPPTEGLRRP
jgi:hypothetical protein